MPVTLRDQKGPRRGRLDNVTAAHTQPALPRFPGSPGASQDLPATNSPPPVSCRPILSTAVRSKDGGAMGFLPLFPRMRKTCFPETNGTGNDPTKIRSSI